MSSISSRMAVSMPVIFLQLVTCSSDPASQIKRQASVNSLLYRLPRKKGPPIEYLPSHSGQQDPMDSIAFGTLYLDGSAATGAPAPRPPRAPPLLPPPPAASSGGPSLLPKLAAGGADESMLRFLAFLLPYSSRPSGWTQKDGHWQHW